MATAKYFLMALLIFVSVFFSSYAFSASISVTPLGNGKFVINGNSMDGVAAISLNITYDSSSLSSPKIDQGSLTSGGMFAANPNFTSDTVRIAILKSSGFSGSGQLAVITFATHTGSGTLSVSSSMIDSKTAPLPDGGKLTVSDFNSSSIETSSIVSSNIVQSSQTSQPTQNTPVKAAINPTYLGSVTLPTDQQQRAESQSSTIQNTPIKTPELIANKISDETKPSEKSVAESAPEETPQYVVYKGVLERFKHLAGKKFSDAVALFDKKASQIVNQEPSILLSDGKSKATLTVDIPSRKNISPNFAVSGAELLSFGRDKENSGRWIVEVLPEADSYRVTVTVINGADEFEFPLTVSPPIVTKLTLDENGWERFIEETGSVKPTLHDYNRDGVADYIDEFIFVANCLANRRKIQK